MRLRRWRWALVGLVGLELLYVLAGNSFLHQAWGRRLINRRPQKLSVSWESAWTWLPGLVSVRGLALGGTSRRVSWQARMDRGAMFIWLPSLALRHFHVLWGTPVGVEAGVDLIPPAEESEAPKHAEGWRVTLGGLDLTELRRVRLDGYELVGSGRLEGKASFQVRGPMELRIGRLLFDGAQFLSGGVVVARDLDIDGGFDTAPYLAGRDTVTDLIGGASGRARVGAHAENLGFLTAYLRGVSWLGLGGVGDLDLTLALDEGTLLPGTALSVTGPEVRADFFDFRAQGTGRVSGEVPRVGGEIRLGVVLDEYSVIRLSDGAELLSGEGLETRVVSRSTSLEEPPTDLAGSVHVPPARVSSLATLGAYLPTGTTAKVTGGSAELAFDLSYDTSEHDGEGRLVLDAKEVTGSFGDADVSGDLLVEAAMPHVDLPTGTFDLSGTAVTVENARMTRGGKERTRGWWGRVRVAEGRVQRRLITEDRRLVQKAPALVTADLRGELFDTAPLVLLMEQRLPALRWFDQLLTVSEIDLEGTVTLEGPAMGLRGFRATGGRRDQLEIRAELDFVGKETSGVAYARYRGIDATLALNEGDRAWRLRRAERAWEEASKAYRAEGGDPR